MAEMASLSHIQFVVHDLDKSAERWARDFHAGPFFVSDFLPTYTYGGISRPTPVRFGGGCSRNVLIELIQPTDDTPSVFLDHLKSRGESFLAMRLIGGDLASESQRMLRSGYRSATTAESPGNGALEYFDAYDASGCLFLIMPGSDFMHECTRKIHEAHERWDFRTRPIRPFSEVLQA